MRKLLVALLSVSGFLALASASVSARTLPIEQVYWNHRIWPKENPQAKDSYGAHNRWYRSAARSIVLGGAGFASRSNI